MAQERYINPYTDFGFKKLFGTEFNKDLLISFLNALMEQSEHNSHDAIIDVEYLNAEHLGRTATERKAIFDVFCKTQNGGRFIVEMQNVFQQFFKDRSIYYSTFPIVEQIKKKETTFELQKIYTVGILNFVFRDDIDTRTSKHTTVEADSDDPLHHEVMLVDLKTNKVFFDKLVYIYLEMPKFQKTESELVTMYDKWLFVLKNLSKLFERPAALQERIFTKLFEQAEIAKFSPDEIQAYEESVNAYRDIVNAVNDAEMKGFKNGILETARRMKTDGLSIDIISKYTQLPPDEIERL